MQRLFASAALCLLFAATTTVAHATPWTEVGEVTNVRFDGVDFNNTSDVKAFYGRLEQAAHKVCDVAGHSLEVREDNADCRARAIDGAVADLKKTRLNELHAERTGRGDAQLADARRSW